MPSTTINVSRSRSMLRRAAGVLGVIASATAGPAYAADLPVPPLPGSPATEPPVASSPWLAPLAPDLIPGRPGTLQAGASTLDPAAVPPLVATSAPQPVALADCDTGACTLAVGGTVRVGARRFALAGRTVAVGAGTTRPLLVALPGGAVAVRRAGEPLRLRLTVFAVAGSGHRGRVVVPVTVR